jgi:signal recognition particle subunit SRP54
MFSNLSRKLLSIFGSIRNRGILTKEVLDSTLEEVRVSLIEADVSLSVVKTFIANLRGRLEGQNVETSVAPDQVVIKAVYDEIVSLLGGGQGAYNPSGKRAILMSGLQGVGKTTTSAKLAYLLKTKFKKDVLLVSLDTYRPAAVEQLRKLAHQNGIHFFEDVDESTDDPISIARRTVQIRERYDSIIYDTAGRTQIDERMMKELSSIKSIVQPDEIFMVLDSMAGQDSVNVARSFNEAIGISGLILTRVDGDSRGGSALSAKFVTNCQIKYVCTGEKINDISEFHPDRIASRILDKGDMLSLAEKALDGDSISDDKISQKFDLESMATYLKQLEKIGGLGGILKFIPGMGKVRELMTNVNQSERVIAKQRAIIQSMTMKERREPNVLNASRRRRIAAGCGLSVTDVNVLIKQFDQMKTMMKRMNKKEPPRESLNNMPRRGKN